MVYLEEILFLGLLVKPARYSNQGKEIKYCTIQSLKTIYTDKITAHELQAVN